MLRVTREISKNQTCSLFLSLSPGRTDGSSYVSIYLSLFIHVSILICICFYNFVSFGIAWQLFFVFFVSICICIFASMYLFVSMYLPSPSYPALSYPTLSYYILSCPIYLVDLIRLFDLII